MSATALAEDGTLYVGGTFTRVGPRTGAGAVIESGTGLAAPSFPAVDNGVVYSCVPDGSGGWFIGGTFTSVGGVARSRIAHLLANGTVDPSFNPSADGTVRALALSGPTLYVGGEFTTIDGQSRNRIAALNATTGAATAWNPNCAGQVLTLAVYGATVYAGGNIVSIGGQPRQNLAALDSTTGDATAFNPAPNGTVMALAVDPVSSVLYVGGVFTSLGGFTRNRIAALSATTGAVSPTWDANANSTVLALAHSGTTVYVGGMFTTIGGQSRSRIAALSTANGAATGFSANTNNNAVSALAISGTTLYAGGDFSTIGGVSRSRIAALSSTTGVPTAWDPSADGSVSAISVSGSAVYVGGSFNLAGGAVRNRIAALDPASGEAAAWNPNADGAVEALVSAGPVVYAGGSFSNIGGQARSRIAALDANSGNATSWNPGANNMVRALAVSGSTVYAGGDFSTIGGQTRSRIAALDAADGSATSWNPGASNTVFALAPQGDTVYAGGFFTVIGGQPRNYIAAIDAVTGAVTPWNPDCNLTVYTLAPAGAVVYAGGSFTTVGGQPRNCIAAIDAATGAATAWDPGAGATVYALGLSGSTVFAGGAFTTIGGESRRYLAALDASSGAVTSWDPDANNYAYALSVSDSAVHAGGAFTTIGGKSFSRIARFTRESHLILDYDFAQEPGVAVVDNANGIVGTPYGTVWSTDPGGRSVLYFDNPIKHTFGDGDYFQIPDHDGLDSEAFSVELLVYPMSTGYYTEFMERIKDGGTFQTIMSMGLASTGYTTGSQPRFGITVGGEAKSVVSPEEIPLGAWSHLVGTYDGVNLRLYVDGELVAEGLDIGGPRDTGSNPLYLGHAPSSNHYFNGYFGEFKMYSRALTAEEAALVYNVPPVAIDDIADCDEDTYATLNVLDNDLDADGDDLTAELVREPINGSVELAPSGEATYTPDPDWNGIDTFTYRAWDGIDHSEPATVTITVHPVDDPPVADAGGPYVTAEGAELTLDGSGSHDPDAPVGEIVKYEWDLDGDGLFGDASGETTIVVFPDDGFFEIALRVTDDSGLTDVDTTTVTVTNVAPTLAPLGPLAAEEGAELSVPIEFGDRGLEDTHTVTIDWGDGTAPGIFEPVRETGETSGTLTPSHTYADDRDGGYTVTVTVEDDDGGTTSDTLTVTVTNVAPTVKPIELSSPSPVAGQSFTASAGYTDPGVLDTHSAAWDWGDGTSSTGVVAGSAGSGTVTGSHTYASAGTYTATCTVTDKDGDLGSRTVEITVQAGVTPLPPVINVEGDDRFQTALAASLLAYPNGLDPAGARTVVIATGRNWPDALGGTSLAGALDGPILLVEPARVPDGVTGEIERLGATKAIILGGTGAVSAEVEMALADLLGEDDIDRIGGANRYVTADMVAARTRSVLGAGWDGTAFVATGANFPDALAAAPLAARQGWPLYLADPNTGLAAATKSAMAGVSDVVILGGTAVVSTGTEGYLETIADVTRLGGADRYETAVLVSTYAVSTVGHVWNRVGITTGANFPDALAGGVVQGKAGSVMLLTPPTVLSERTRAALAGNKAAITTVTYFGGPGAVSPSVRAAVTEALK